MKKLELPKSVLVKIIRDKSGVFVAELPDFNLHTEADSFFELTNQINDLIMLFFNVPKSKKSLIRYLPPQPEKPIEEKNYFAKYPQLFFNMFSAGPCVGLC